MGDPIAADAKQMFLALNVDQAERFFPHQRLYFKNLDVLICPGCEQGKTFSQETVQDQDDPQNDEQAPDNPKVIGGIAPSERRGGRGGGMKTYQDNSQSDKTAGPFFDWSHGISLTRGFQCGQRYSQRL